MAGFAAGAFTAAVLNYIENRDKVDYLLIYDDWMENVQAETEKMFEILGVPNEHIPIAMTALSKDSQGKFFGDTDGKRKNALSPQQRKEIDELYKMLDVPLKYDMTINEFRAYLK